MNKKSIHCLTGRQVSKKVKTQSVRYKQNSGDKYTYKDGILRQYHQQRSKFQLNHKKQRNLNDDYFYSHTDQKQSLHFRDTEFIFNGQPQQKQSSKTFSQPEQQLQAQMEELKIITSLNAKILQLQSSFTRIQSAYRQKISDLRNQLNYKTQQTQQLSEVLQSLAKEQKSATNQVEMLMKIFLAQGKPLQNQVVVNKQNQQKQTLVGVLPLNSKREQTYCDDQKPKPKSRRMKASQTMFRKAHQRGQDNNQKVMRSEELLSKIKNRPGFTGAAIGRNMQSCRIKK